MVTGARRTTTTSGARQRDCMGIHQPRRGRPLDKHANHWTTTTRPSANCTATTPRPLTSYTHPYYRSHDPLKRLRRRRQQRNRPNSKPTDHMQASATRNRPHCYKCNTPTANRSQANRPIPNRPNMQGSKRERRPQDWRHHSAPPPPTMTPTNTSTHETSAIIQPTNRRQQTTTHPRPPESVNSTETGGVSTRYGMRVP